MNAPDTEYRILLVDDDPDDRLIVEDLLDEITTWTPRLSTASSYEEGLALVRRERFDVALVDYRLGARRGDAFVSEAEVRAAGLPVIILTGQGGLEVDLAAGRAGAADFLPKRGLNAMLLERSIRYTVETHREHRRGDRFRALVESSRDLLGILDASGRFEYLSPSVKGILGFEPQEKLGKSSFGQLHPDDEESARQTFARLLEEPGGWVRFSYRVAHQDGSWRVLDTVGQNLLADPLIGGIVLNAWDITELEERRRQSQFQAAILEQVGQMVLAVDAESRVTYWNAAAEAQTGYSAEEVMGRTILEELVVEEDHARALEARQTAQAGDQWTGELRIRVKDGRTLRVQLTVSPANQPGGLKGGRIAVGVDVTDLRRTQQERLRAAERIEFQASLLDAVGQAVIATDLEGIVTYWNRAAEVMFGWSAEEALGHSITDLTPAIDERERAAEIMAALRQGEQWAGEMELQRRDGSSFHALVTDAPIRDESGELSGVVGVTSDLTERRALEEQLRQAQKMEAVGRLAGGVAHDFNNMLTAIQGHASILDEDLPTDSSFREDVGHIMLSTDRAAALTRQLLAFSRKQVIEPRIVDLGVLVRKIEPMLRRLIPESVELRLELPSTRVPVLVDPGQLDQVVLNLVVNAIDAIAGSGLITIAIDEVRLLSEEDLRGDLEPGPHARLTVVDTGSGIAPDLMDRLFEPFFTTKPKGKGTGLGLSTVYGIVRQAHGHLDVTSAPGEGATFQVWLPIAAGDSSVDGADRGAPSSIPPDRAVIMLVEDDHAVRRLVKRTLEREGHTVIEAADGHQAIAQLRDRGASVDLLLSDVVMPAMGGHELARRLLEAHPQLRIILTSGYSDADLRGEVRSAGDAFLVKPFTTKELLNMVADVLSR